MIEPEFTLADGNRSVQLIEADCRGVKAMTRKDRPGACDSAVSGTHVGGYASVVPLTLAEAEVVLLDDLETSRPWQCARGRCLPWGS